MSAELKVVWERSHFGSPTARPLLKETSKTVTVKMPTYPRERVFRKDADSYPFRAFEELRSDTVQRMREEIDRLELELYDYLPRRIADKKVELETLETIPEAEAAIAFLDDR